MSLPKIVYGSSVTLQCARGPVGFECFYQARVHDNLSTSGKVRERVMENADMLIAFDMPNMLVSDDYPTWATFMATALTGASFKFYPNAALSDYYNCVDESNGEWKAARNGPGKYAASFLFRILQDAQAPSDPGVVMKRFYGVAT